MINIKIVTLNNKSRKGDFVYIKAPKVRGMYYKYKEDSYLDSYKQYYIDRFVKKKSKGRLREYINVYTDKVKGRKIKRTPVVRQAEQYLRKVKKQPLIESVMMGGISSAKVNNIFRSNEQQVIAASKKLLGGLVLDNEILNLLIKEENMKKIKKRLEYKLDFIDRNGDLLGRSGVHNKTVREVINDIKTRIKWGEESNYSFGEKIRKMGYNPYDERSNGKINRIELTVIFRKAKI